MRSPSSRQLSSLWLALELELVSELLELLLVSELDELLEPLLLVSELDELLELVS